jgi:myo-inositol-1(or 4)-monophosphatase
VEIGHLATALDAALTAGDYFQTRVDSDFTVKAKSSPADLVTDIDQACERLIHERIVKDYPDHQFLGEESTLPGSLASMEATRKVVSAKHLWIVDPIDGTTNFVQGMPLSVVSIAYAEQGDVKVGAIYDPYRKEVFYAVRGKGAFCANSAQIREWIKHPSDSLVGVRLAASAEERLSHSVVATGLPSRAPHREAVTLAGLRLSMQLKSFRALGAAALHLAYVAAGRIDGFWEYDLNAWDVAAGVLLIREAGGYVKELGHGQYHLGTRHIVAAGRERLAHQIESIVNVLNGEEGTLC